MSAMLHGVILFRTQTVASVKPCCDVITLVDRNRTVAISCGLNVLIGRGETGSLYRILVKTFLKMSHCYSARHRIILKR
jgi:hypothetical protein